MDDSVPHTPLPKTFASCAPDASQAGYGDDSGHDTQRLGEAWNIQAAWSSETI